MWINVTSLIDTQKLFYLQDKSRDLVSDCDINAPGVDLLKGPYLVLTVKSPAIKLLFDALFDYPCD